MCQKTSEILAIVIFKFLIKTHAHNVLIADNKGKLSKFFVFLISTCLLNLIPFKTDNLIHFIYLFIS